MTPGQMLTAAQQEGATASSVSWQDGVLTILLTAPAAVAATVATTLALQPAPDEAAVDWHTPDPTGTYIGLTQD